MSIVNTVSVTVSDASALLGVNGSTVRRRCLRGDFPGAVQELRDNTPTWAIPLAALGLSTSKEMEFLQARGILPEAKPVEAPSDDQLGALDTLAGWQREIVMKRKALIDRFMAAPHRDWETILSAVKSEAAANRGLSQGTIYRWIKEYRNLGLAGLVPGYGHNKGSSSVPQKAGELFDSLALQESEPSYRDIYTAVKGYMLQMNPDSQIPHLAAFMRRFRARYPEPYRDLRRKGVKFYQRRWEYYIPRSVAEIPAGDGWFSDHHQLDTLVLLPNGKQCRPWLTVWRDVRSMRFLSAFLHEEDPCSDHIFYSFYLAVKRYGLPRFVYIDNGKDYRSKDFTGETRREIPEIEAEQRKARSLCGLLDIHVTFALPYNAQAKSVERDFQRIINKFSRLMPGYTGSHPAARPEITRKQAAAGDLLPIADAERLVNEQIENVINRERSHGRTLNGMTPEEAWVKFRGEERKIPDDRIKFLLMRTSKEYRIDRNGICDRELGIELRYWAEWMFPLRGTMVYMRRDIQDYRKAWVWAVESDALLGEAEIAETIPLCAETPIAKDALKKEIARKRQDLKAARDATRPPVHISSSDLVRAMATGVAADAPDLPLDPMGTPSVRYMTTHLDPQFHAYEQAERTGTDDLIGLSPEAEYAKRDDLSFFSCDKQE